MIEIIDKNKEKRTLLFIIGLILLGFLILVLCKVNISNMREYEVFLPKNIAEVNTISVGKPRAIRSDEWLVNVSNNFYELNNRTVPDGIPQIIVSLINIPKWGYFLLPNDMAFSFQTLVMYFILVIAGVFFFRIFGKGDWIFILGATTILVFQPAIAWWNTPSTFAIFLSIIDLFYYFFVNKKITAKVLCCVGLVLCMGYYVVAAYPAWMIPLGYLALFILVGVYTQHKEFPIKKHDILYIVVTVIAIGLTAYCYYLTQKSFIEAVMNTVYPGHRQIAGGGLRLRYLAHYLTAIKMPFQDITFSNNSEASTFLSFFPVPWVVYALRYKQLKEYKIIPGLLAFTAMTFIYVRWGFGETFAKYSFWSWTTPDRVIIIADFAMLLALLTETYYLNVVKTTGTEGNNDLAIMLLSNILVLSFLAIPVIRNNQILKYLGLPTYIAVAVTVLIVLNLILAGRQKAVLLIVMCISIVAGATVNPINIGTELMEETPLAKEIKKIDADDSGRWITNNDLVVSKYVRAQGVDCLNALSYPPRFDLFYPIDSEKKYENVYNRYAHVVVSIGAENGKFDLLQPDAFSVNIDDEGLRLWDVKYIVSNTNIELHTANIYIKKVYEDIDGYDIYKVTYE